LYFYLCFPERKHVDGALPISYPRHCVSSATQRGKDKNATTATVRVGSTLPRKCVVIPPPPPPLTTSPTRSCSDSGSDNDASSEYHRTNERNNNTSLYKETRILVVQPSSQPTTACPGPSPSLEVTTVQNEMMEAANVTARWKLGVRQLSDSNKNQHSDNKMVVPVPPPPPPLASPERVVQEDKETNIWLACGALQCV
jgi:hypothetical protein